MRLIDADRLIAKITAMVTRPHQFMYEIERAPTVEAIPVEWFKKKMDWYLENAIYGAEVYQWVLNRWYEDKENWEKENDNKY